MRLLDANATPWPEYCSIRAYLFECIMEACCWLSWSHPSHLEATCVERPLVLARVKKRSADPSTRIASSGLLRPLLIRFPLPFDVVFVRPIWVLQPSKLLCKLVEEESSIQRHARKPVACLVQIRSLILCHLGLISTHMWRGCGLLRSLRINSSVGS